MKKLAIVKINSRDEMLKNIAKYDAQMHVHTSPKFIKRFLKSYEGFFGKEVEMKFNLKYNAWQVIGLTGPNSRMLYPTAPHLDVTTTRTFVKYID